MQDSEQVAATPRLGLAKGIIAILLGIEGSGIVFAIPFRFSGDTIPISALRDLVRISRYDYRRDPWHTNTTQLPSRGAGNVYVVPGNRNIGGCQ